MTVLPISCRWPTCLGVFAPLLLASCALRAPLQIEPPSGESAAVTLALRDVRTPARVVDQVSNDEANCRVAAARHTAFDPDELDVPPHLRIVIRLPPHLSDTDAVRDGAEPSGAPAYDWYEPPGLPALELDTLPRVDAPLQTWALQLMPIMHLNSDQAWRVVVELAAIEYRAALIECFQKRGYGVEQQSH